jgi:predicted PurR-regulated permease PerM
VPNDPKLSRERLALGWLALAALVAIAWLVHPFATGLLLGTLLGFTLEPLHARLAKRTGRPLLAAVATVAGTLVVLVALAAGFASFFVQRAIAMSETVRDEIERGGWDPAWIDRASGWLARVGLSPESVTERVREGMLAVAERSAGFAAKTASATLFFVLSLFFAFLTMHLVLRHWRTIHTALEALLPLRPEHTRVLLDEFRRVGAATLKGTVLTGIAQGVLAAVGYAVTGVPEPLFFGIATAIASLVPAVGTLLVWVPAGIYLLATGHPAAAAVELVWGALVVVGFSDYVIRPRLVGDEAMPTLLTFLALFGGLEIMGLSGLIVGPVVMALAVTVLRIYAKESAAIRV